MCECFVMLQRINESELNEMSDHHSLSTFTDVLPGSTVSPLFVIPDVCVSTNQSCISHCDLTFANLHKIVCLVFFVSKFYLCIIIKHRTYKVDRDLIKGTKCLHCCRKLCVKVAGRLCDLCLVIDEVLHPLLFITY